MKIKQKITIFAALFAIIGGVAFSSAPVALAQEARQGNGREQTDACPDTSIIDVECSDNGNAEDSGVWQLLLMTLNILTAGVGIAAVGGIVWAAVLYSAAQENADQVKKAKEIIKNVVIGLISYAGMYMIVNFLIPGGIFT